RRTLLRGLGGAAIALPFLESMTPGSASAQTATAPRRVLVVFSPSGTLRNEWIASGGLSDFTFGPLLAPLNDHKDKIIVMQGLVMGTIPSTPVGDGHTKNFGAMLTGGRLTSNNGAWDFADRASFDQLMAQDPNIGGKTRFRSLELSSGRDGNDLWNRMIYAGPKQPVAPRRKPDEVFDLLFSDFTPETGAAPDPAAEARRLQKRSVLDFVGGEYTRLKSRISAQDHYVVDQHFTAIRELEQRVAGAAEQQQQTSSCTVPARPATHASDYYGSDAAYPEMVKLHMDLTVRALACDLTRIASLQLSACSSGTRFTWLGVTEEHHTLSHDQHGDPNVARPKYRQTQVWYAQQIAYLLAEMRKIDEGNGKSLLDNTAVLWCTEVNHGNDHSYHDMSWLLAGSCGGAFQTGRNLQYAPYGTNYTQDLLTSLMQAMGSSVAKLGDPAFCNGPLAGL
ncbi:MAG TPA: DUF1552 domain-containing protein, partial [Myxococcota bacterium]|nr:DUF1552 domain-containing protein [Myxococcota bacterium]